MKKYKVIIFLIMVVAALGVAGGIKFSSVDEHNKESKLVASGLHIEQASGDESDVTNSAVSYTNEKKEKVEKTKQESEKSEAAKSKVSKKDKKTNIKSQNKKSKASTTKNSAKFVNPNATNKPGVSVDVPVDNEQKADATTIPPTNAPEELISCFIEIKADKILEEKEKVDKKLLNLVPADGYLLQKTKVTVKKGSNAYDVLNDVCKATGIAINAKYTPMYKSYYVVGIGNINEKDVSDMSGWVYKVDGKSARVGASSHKVADGETFTWSYTCDGKTS